jgi:hypothetical protein
MTASNRAGRWPTTIVWVHAVVFASVALPVAVSPEIPFGDAAWLPLARLASKSFAASLFALVIMLVSAAVSRTARQVGAALAAVCVLDAQAPYLLFSLPASLEYLDRALGIRWWVMPQTFLILFAVTTCALVSMWRRRWRQRASVPGTA